ncbi:MAG TPA: acetamidase/formamidase family protein [Candidatus Sulfotelmatobacter sp.]|nr:acetamidase/formamidase family protein [Candidatus Sulfotelmatobacter sp.]
MRFPLIASSLVFFATLPASAQNVVRYTATNDNVKYLFATAGPVAHLKSGDILDTNTLDCFGNALRKPGDTVSMAKGDNPLTGPFYIEGAEPGDTLAVKILDLQVDGDTGVGAFSPGFGALNGTHYTPVLEPPLPERVWFYHIDHAANTATFKALDSDFSVKIPMHPFFGCIGVAPANGEARSSIVPAEFGGNMDSPEASVGNTVYFPVNVKGGLFYIGDGHAAMGDGEAAGSAIEVPLKAKVQLSVIKGRKIDWPQFENDDAIMTVGAYRPVDDAARIALTELVHWIHNDYGLSDLDAYELLSKVAKLHFNEMVDPNYVVVASIEKKYLPPKKK